MSELNIYQRMLAVMNDVAYVQKESKKVNNQYTFVSHDAVSRAVRPALIEHGVMPVPHVIRHQSNGNRVELDMVVDFVNVDKPEEKISVESIGFGIDPQDKGPGKAMSYAYKYALLKALALETGDDPERDMIPHEPAAVVSPLAEKLSKSIVEAIEDNNALACYAIDRFEDVDVYTDALGFLPKGKKTAMKQTLRELVAKGQRIYDDIYRNVVDLCQSDDPAVIEHLDDLPDLLKRVLWDSLDATQKTFITNAKKAAA